MLRLMRTGRRYREAGFGLADTLIGVLILGVAAVAFITSLSTGSISAGESDARAIAQSIARAQLEQTKAAPYDPVPSSYAMVPVPSGWSVTVAASTIPEAVGSNIQKITVTVYQGALVKMTVEDFKVNR